MDVSTLRFAVGLKSLVMVVLTLFEFSLSKEAGPASIPKQSEPVALLAYVAAIVSYALCTVIEYRVAVVALHVGPIVVREVVVLAATAVVALGSTGHAAIETFATRHTFRNRLALYYCLIFDFILRRSLIQLASLVTCTVGRLLSRLCSIASRSNVYGRLIQYICFISA